jgi:hypothetical protein
MSQPITTTNDSKSELTIVEPTIGLIDDDNGESQIQFSAHLLSKRMKREVKSVFPKQKVDNLILIATFQQSNNDLVCSVMNANF